MHLGDESQIFLELGKFEPLCLIIGQRNDFLHDIKTCMKQMYVQN